MCTFWKVFDNVWFMLLKLLFLVVKEVSNKLFLSVENIIEAWQKRHVSGETLISAENPKLVTSIQKLHKWIFKSTKNINITQIIEYINFYQQ